MKIIVDWLKDYIDLDVPMSCLVDDLDRIGLMVSGRSENEYGTVLEIEPPPNRPDVLGHLGVARELAAIHGLSLKGNNGTLTEADVPVDHLVDVQIWDDEMCPRYCAVVIRDIEVGPSPDWLQIRLRALGLNPVNNIVDVTQYVLFATAQPLHAFDFDRISGSKIIVRKAKKGEKIRILDGGELSLTPDCLVIADDEKPAALAGIIGGQNASVTGNTRNVMIESAVFHPFPIRTAGREFGIQTEAAFRFERGVDVSFAPKAASIAASLLTQMGGTAAKGMIDIYPKPVKKRTVVLRRHRIKELLATDVKEDFIEKTLSRLGFELSLRQQGGWQVNVPTYRVDIEREVDLIEEVARFHGYDKIPSTLPPLSGLEPVFSPRRRLLEHMRRSLFHSGFDEVVNGAFSSEERESPNHPKQKVIEILNPISARSSVLKTTLLNGLLENAEWNLNRGAQGISLFEIGKVYFWEDDQAKEQQSLGLVISGLQGIRNWRVRPECADFFHLKGVCEDILFHLRYEPISFLKRDHPRYEKDFSLAVLVKGEEIGILGRLNQSLCESFSLREEIWGAELNLTTLLAKQPQPFNLEPVVKYPSVIRDVSLLGSENIDFQEIKEAVERLSLPFLKSFDLYDRFSGKRIPSGKMSFSFRFVFAHPQRTLLTEEVDGFLAKIVKTFKSTFNFQMREGGGIDK